MKNILQVTLQGTGPPGEQVTPLGLVSSGRVLRGLVYDVVTGPTGRPSSAGRVALVANGGATRRRSVGRVIDRTRVGPSRAANDDLVLAQPSTTRPVPVVADRQSGP